MAKISVFVSSKFLHPKAIQNVQHPHPALLGSIRYLRFHPRFPTQFTQLARNWLLIKFSSVTVSPACPTSSNSQLQLPVFSEGCSLAHSMNLHVYQMKPEYKAANSVQHIFTSKTGANNNMSFTFNVLKEMAMPETHRQMHKHMQCTCSSHCCEKWGTFQHLPRFRTDSAGTQISLSSNKAKILPGAPLIQDHPLRPLTSSGCNHQPKQMGWERTELSKSTKKGESQNKRMPMISKEQMGSLSTWKKAKVLICFEDQCRCKDAQRKA